MGIRVNIARMWLIRERVRDKKVVQVAVLGVPVGLGCLAPRNRDYRC
jgi:hypothetical protein